jgi:hypothetical protein
MSEKTLDPEVARQTALAEEGLSRYRKALRDLAALPDAAIDTADIPEAPAENWIDARRANTC